MPEETWADKGRYPLIKSENRGDIVYGWSLKKKLLDVAHGKLINIIGRHGIVD